MALKTGYKVNNEEIILDDYSAYEDDSIIDTCTKTLDGYYKVNGNDIKASYYVEGKGQIPAELPGDSYYKAPSGAQKFALYGTNTVGGLIGGSESKWWSKYSGNSVNEGYKEIYLMYDGTRFGEAEQDSIGYSYYIKKTIRTYEYNPNEIKLWCMMVSAGGGGGYSPRTDTYPRRSGGGGGAAAYICLRLKANEILHVRIPPALAVNDGDKVDSSGNHLNTLDVSIIRGTLTTSKSDNILKLSSGEAGLFRDYALDKGGSGGKQINLNYVDGVYSIQSIQGSSGGGCSINQDTSRGESNSHSFFNFLGSDYYPLWGGIENNGGDALYRVQSNYMGGGGASPFPKGAGGYMNTNAGYMPPEQGCGGGGGASWSSENIGYSSSGAFWLLCA